MATPGPSNSAPSPAAQASSSSSNAQSIITALGNAFRTQGGDPLPGDQIARMLLQNMPQLGELAKQGKLNQQQIMQLKEFADKHKAAAAALAAPGPGTTIAPPVATPPATAPAPANKPGPSYPGAFKSSSPPLLSSNPNSGDTYPIPQLVPDSNPGPVAWSVAQQGRPTLTGGVTGGRIAGTPSQVTRVGDDVGMLAPDDTRARRKNAPGDQSMRRSIQDLVSSIDPSVKIESEVEDLLLDIADEFIDSVANFGCRLAKHRGGDTLEVRDLQLHLERNHNIRIPGFASDETRTPLSQASTTPAAGAAGKKGGAGTHMTLRSHRLAQVQQAKRDGKLL